MKKCVVNRDMEGNITSVEVVKNQMSTSEVMNSAVEKNNGYDLDKAPNGNDSILYNEFINRGLTPVEAREKVATVYTDSFIEWFGDWINNPSDSSQVVDENGQPKVVWSGQVAPVEEYKAYNNREEGTDNIDNDGFFSEDKRVATSYATGLDAFSTPQAMIDKYGSKTASVVPVFLNIRSAVKTSDINRTTITPIIEESIKNNNDGFFGKFHNYDSNGWVVIDADQIIAVDNLTTGENSFDKLSKIQEERDYIEEEAKSNGTWMLTPNGKPTNLTEDQWITVRTADFIAWFGDFINDPEKASTVVDENGEPLPVLKDSMSYFQESLKGLEDYERFKPAEMQNYTKITGQSILLDLIQKEYKMKDKFNINIDAVHYLKNYNTKSKKVNDKIAEILKYINSNNVEYYIDNSAFIKILNEIQDLDENFELDTIFEFNKELLNKRNEVLVTGKNEKEIEKYLYENRDLFSNDETVFLNIRNPISLNKEGIWYSFETPPIENHNVIQLIKNTRDKYGKLTKTSILFQENVKENISNDEYNELLKNILEKSNIPLEQAEYMKNNLNTNSELSFGFSFDGSPIVRDSLLFEIEMDLEGDGIIETSFVTQDSIDNYYVPFKTNQIKSATNRYFDFDIMFIPSELYEQLKQQPFINPEQALEIYKNIYSEDMNYWKNEDLNCE